VVYSRKTNDIQIWEITNDQRFDAGDRRIEMTIEFPSFTGKSAFELKELESARIWIDKMLGTVEFTAYYRPDQWPCYIFWHQWKQCTAKDCTQDPDANQPCYPAQPYCESFEPDMCLPKPPQVCLFKNRKTPSNQAYSFQVKLVIKGWARVRGFMVDMLPKSEPPFNGLVC